MTYFPRDTGQNIGAVFASMQDGKGVTRGFTGTEGFRARATAATQAASRKIFGPVPLSEAELAILRQIEKRVRG